MKTTINNKIMSQRLSAPGLYLIHGHFNTGKTLLALKIACSVASESKRVLFVNGVLRGKDLQDQLKAILVNMDLENKSLPIWFASSELPFETFDLSTRPSLEMLEEFVISDGIQLIVLNNVGTLCYSKQGKLKWWCLKMRDEGRAVLVIRTDYRGKKGTKTFRPDRKDLFDAIIRLTRPEGCHISIGHFHKARDLRGAAMKDFTIPL
jgi:hypothetical protein